MKKIIKPGILLLLSGWFVSGTCAGQDSLALKMISNSFKKEYALQMPALKYTYIEQQQIHDYSGNWDFDRDGKKDGLLFTGNGGAHVYYYLDIILSANPAATPLARLAFDFPYFDRVIERDVSMPLPQFVVGDFDQDGTTDIYLYFDAGFSTIPDAWSKQGIQSGPVVLTYKNNNWTVRTYKP